MSDEISQARRNLLAPDQMNVESRATEKMMLEGIIFKKKNYECLASYV